MLPSITASTFNSRAICGNGFRAPLYPITEVREITRKALICPSVAISWSVIPSAKYSWDASPERFSSGSTARDRIVGDCPRDWSSQPTRMTDARASPQPVIVNVRCQPRPLGAVVCSATSRRLAIVCRQRIAAGRWRVCIRRSRLEVDNSHVCDEAVTTSGHCLDEARTLGGITQRLADLVDGFVEPVIEVDERIRGPQSAPELVAGHQLARPGQQHREHLKRLLLKPDPRTALPQLASPKIGLEDPETKTARNVTGLLHGGALSVTRESTTRLPAHKPAGETFLQASVLSGQLARGGRSHRSKDGRTIEAAVATSADSAACTTNIW